MTLRSFVQSALLIGCGAIIGVAAVQWTPTAAAQTPDAARGRAAAPPPTLASLSADVERLKTLIPSNSHIMMDVQWHWTNLWFAAQAKNWTLAQYQFNEARNHMQWLIKKSPTMRSAGPDREEVNVEGIFNGIDTSGLADVKATIEKKDLPKFNTAYRAMLESCYSCHKSVGRPYIKPMVPKAQAQSIMNMDPNADWPH